MVSKHGTIIVLVGFMALYTGLILWRLFVRLDSARHPLKTYGDIAERIFGKAARHTCTVLQSIQLLFNVRFIHGPIYLLFNKYDAFKNRLGQFVWAMAKRSLKWPEAGYVPGCISLFCPRPFFFTIMTALFLCVHSHMDVGGLRFRTDPYFEGMDI